MKKASSLTKRKQQPKRKTIPAPVNPKLIASKAPEPTPKQEAATFNPAYILKGDMLQQRPPDHPVDKAQKTNFKTEAELEQLILKNTGMIFGEKTLVITTRNRKGDFYEKFFADGFLIDLRESGKPRIYFIKVAFSQNSFVKLFFEIKIFLSFLKDANNVDKLSVLLSGIIGKDNEMRNLIKEKTGNGKISDFLTSVFQNTPTILLMADAGINETPEMLETYNSMWGSAVKSMIITKYSSGKSLFCDITPPFAELKVKVPAKAEKKPKLTEADHLENASNTVREIYLKIKTEIMKTDKTVEFRPKGYYISIRKNRNLAFIHFRRKTIDIVVMNPEKDTRKQIKFHTIKSLTASVQKFWNGECCTIVIDKVERLNDVIVLLKQLVKNA